MNIYTTEFLKVSLRLLLDQISDLQDWSAHNDDKYNEEILEIREKILKLQEKVVHDSKRV